MALKIKFVIFCMVGLLIPDVFCRQMHRNRPFNAALAKNAKQVVVQLDMPDHENVPEICLYYNGNKRISNNTGINLFPSPEKVPHKWYFLVSRHVYPLSTQKHDLTTLSIDPEKAHRLFSCTWDTELDEWIIKEKKENSLKKREYKLKHPEATVIINMHPRYLKTLGNPRIEQSSSDTNSSFFLPLVELQNDADKPFSKRQSAKSLLYNQTRVGAFHRPIEESISTKLDGKTAVRISQLNRS